MLFYTYILIDPRTGQPFYVGKGKYRRMYDHWKHRNAKCCKNERLKQILNEIHAAGLKPTYIKALEDVSESQALAKEVELVLLHGRIDIKTGSLCNLTNGGAPGATTWSPETRERKRQIELAKEKGRPVNQYTMNGEFITRFTSSKVASECVPGANRSYITQVCKGKRKTAGGFMWTYEGEPAPTYTHAYHKAVEQRTKAGELINTYVSLTDAAKAVGVDVRLISHACTGRAKTCKGFVWRYNQ